MRTSYIRLPDGRVRQGELLHFELLLQVRVTGVDHCDGISEMWGENVLYTYVAKRFWRSAHAAQELVLTRLSECPPRGLYFPQLYSHDFPPRHKLASSEDRLRGAERAEEDVRRALKAAEDRNRCESRR